MNLQALHEHVLDAEKRIRPYIRTTFLDHSIYLSNQTKANVYLKHEEQQHTGSFKVRGALNRILSLTDEESKNGVICASAGNHGCAVAYAGKLLNIQATVYLPKHTSSLKVDKIKSYGATIQFVEGDCLEAERQARNESERCGMVYISPYNDPFVMAGQGTLGIELEKQLPELEAVFISVGGGGLIGGVASYLKAVKPNIEIVGVWPENAPAMSKCIEAGKIIDVAEKPTWSESTAGGVEEGAITFEPCKSLIDSHIWVSEDEIKEAMNLIAEKESCLIEGAAGVAVAGLLQQPKRYTGKNIAILLCGKNIPYPLFREVTQ
jgi:threonine dehydratase